MDDYLNNENTSGILNINSVSEGSIETVGDRDWFRIDLTSGQQIQIDLFGRTSTRLDTSHDRINHICNGNCTLGGGSEPPEFIFNRLDNPLSDSLLRLYNSNNELVASDDDSGEGLFSSLTFTATDSGEYYASAASYGDYYTGNYSISASLLSETVIDDYLDNSSTSGNLIFDTTINGILDFEGDRDWFAINVSNGDNVKIDLDGISLSDTFLRLFDYQGNLIQFNDDGGNGLNSSLEFTATYDGKYYASAASYGDFYTGNYSILATKANESNVLGSDENDYLIGFEGDNTYQFGMGYDVIDYSNLSESITLSNGGTVDKGSLGTDTFLDFYDKIIATNSSNDLIDGFTNGGLISSLEVNLMENNLIINDLPGIGSKILEIENFENISGTSNSDTLIGNSSRNILNGNSGDDFLSGEAGRDNLDGGLGDDFLYGGLGRDNLDGGLGDDFLYGGGSRDLLFGGDGNDTFFFGSARDSKISRKGTEKLDWIKDFDISNDKIHFSEGVSQESFSYIGTINDLSNKNINKLLRKKSNYDYDAISFDLITTGQTFVAINGSKDGFQSNRDLLVDITGFNGDINNLNITTGIDPNYPLI